MSERSLARPVLLLLLAGLLQACVPYLRAEASVDGRFELLWERELSQFEQQLAVERHTGSADAWTDVGEAWLRLINCEDLTEEDVGEPMAAFVLATIRAEDTRRRMAIHQAQTRRVRVSTETLAVDVTRPTFFERSRAEIGPDFIEWPPMEEGWVDEVPARVAVDSECRDLTSRVMETRVRPDDDDSPRRRYGDWMEAYFDDVAEVSERFAALSARDREGTPAEVEWRTRFHAADVADRAADAWAEFATRARRRAESGREAEKNREAYVRGSEREGELRATTHSLLESLVGETPAAVEPVDGARARLLLAAYQVRAERPARALELLAEARAIGLDDANVWAARYLELRLASDAARWDDAVQLADALPPRTSPYFSAYFYRAATALQRTGQEERFLNVAMKAFRDKPYKSDPFVRALYWQTLQGLADYPFDDRVIEILEELGQRGGTYERVAEYARTALDRGESENARAAATWLLARHHDARFHPQYHGILALAAFIEDDITAFDEAMSKVALRADVVVDAIASHRRSTFFAHADSELARVLRQMLPVMAEWGESPAARDRRQRWLGVIVVRTQSFLRGSRETLVRPQLVELYRLASGLLDDHPRGYAERVGEAEAAPIILGTVRVERRDLRDFEPEIRLQVPTPYSLALIPRDGLPPSRWPTRWPATGEEGR